MMPSLRQAVISARIAPRPSPASPHPPSEKTNPEPTSSKIWHLPLHEFIAELEKRGMPLAPERPKAVNRLDVKEIVRECGRAFLVSPADIINGGRQPSITRPRHIAMYVARKMFPKKSLPDLGRHFGGRDHTTVLHAIRKIETERLTDVQLNSDINRIIARLGERFPEG
jgi:hypothetical protein